METKTILDWSVTYGLGTVLSVGIAFAAWRVLIFVLKENSKREDRLAGIIEIHIKELSEKSNHMADAIILHDKNEAEYFRSMREADAYQREEHRAITEVLRTIKDDLQRFAIK